MDQRAGISVRDRYTLCSYDIHSMLKIEIKHVQVWNPLLYAMLNLQLRAAFVDLMPECLREYFGMKQEKSSPLIGETASRLTQTKYGANGSTQTQVTGNAMARDFSLSFPFPPFHSTRFGDTARTRFISDI